jgi:WhiB family redox-sensing transcriptional regulator
MAISAELGNDSSNKGSLGAYVLAVPDMPWLNDAACGDLPLEQLNIFFVEAGRTIAASTVALCAKCPVRAECLDHAYRHDIFSGYFGGVSPGRRRILSRSEALAEIGHAEPAA